MLRNCKQKNTKSLVIKALLYVFYQNKILFEDNFSRFTLTEKIIIMRY